jgi:hypothetical protein
MTSELRAAVRSVSTIAIGAILTLAACGGEANPFELTIPPDVETLDEALAYVRMREGQRPTPLADNEEVSISSLVVSSPEVTPPDILVEVKGPGSAEQAVAAKEKWAQRLRSLFDRWDICDIDIGWSITTRPDVNPGSQDPFGDIGLDSTFAKTTPGCTGEGSG